MFKEGETFFVSDLDFYKWVRVGSLKIKNLLNIPGFFFYVRFIKRNTNRYFKKHLGFTYASTA